MANVDQPGGGDVDLPDGTWSVAELNEEITTILEASNDRLPTYVVGEVSDVSHYDFGTFFDLRDLDGEALISCLAWSYAIDGFDHDLEAGTSAVVQASVEYHAEKGNMQLMVSDYWPLGESARVQELEALRAALDEEGLLDADRKREVPAYPRTVGVVTSLSGSAREDVCSAIHDRAPGVDVKLCGATVQGENAVSSVIGAVEHLDRDPTVDVLIVTRGGGADADLWCFNAEPLVRRLGDCRTPVVAAIGHEDDRTLADDVADERCMTPTDAGVNAVPDMAVVRRGIGDLERRIDDAYRGFVDGRLEELDRRVATAHESLQQTVATQRAERRGQLQRASALEARIHGAYASLVADRLDGLEQRLDGALRDLEHAAETEAVTARAARGRVADLEARIDGAYETRVERELASLETRIESAYREREADARVAAGTAEARRLRVVVAVLLAVLVIGGVVVAALLLGLV
ncbi:exodeoxyribonuclease VII large subunit [Haloglomus salinum]|uniref:exodeoxyribonuclease VII large subunit n=1 Tax=Haloglomus salinum TaxID=2962673 RepID=UPI0020C9D098|nr:exodeoxyribonuclease VII large subunit [Haloglomus salinum]